MDICSLSSKAEVITETTVSQEEKIQQNQEHIKILSQPLFMSKVES